MSIYEVLVHSRSIYLGTWVRRTLRQKEVFSILNRKRRKQAIALSHPQTKRRHAPLHILFQRFLARTSGLHTQIDTHRHYRNRTPMSFRSAFRAVQWRTAQSLAGLFCCFDENLSKTSVLRVLGSKSLTTPIILLVF